MRKKIHGLKPEFLATQPLFSESARQLQELLKGNEVIIHNAEFDCEFLNHEFKLCGLPSMEEICGKITCSLNYSRSKVRTSKHNLDDLCKHFGIDVSHRTTHHARLDTELLAKVYYLMIREQTSLTMNDNHAFEHIKAAPIISATISEEELKNHEKYMQDMEKESKKTAVWRGLERD